MIDYNKFKRAIQHLESQCITKVVLARKKYSPEGSGSDSAGNSGKPGRMTDYGK